MLRTITGRVIVLVLALTASSNSWATKFFVAINNKDVFAQLHAQYILGENAHLNSIQATINGQTFRPFGTVNATLKDSLKNLTSIVVDIDDPDVLSNLKSSKYVQFVEKEVFHPAPRPVQGFHAFKPWDVSLIPLAQTRHQAGVPSLPWGISAVHAPEAWKVNGMGAGARVMVLDTGIDQNHPALASAIEKVQDFTGASGGTDVTDTVGHGTHVSGTIAGRQLAGGFAGVAPEAKLLMGRVCLSDGCSNIAVATGINWAITEHVDAVSMSLGGPLGTMAEKKACEDAIAAGVTVVAATGNDGTAKVSFPAAFPGVIAVGAVDSTLARASFSQYGPEIAVVAPGVAVVSSVPMGSGRESKVSVTSSQSTEDVKSVSFVGSPEVKQPLSNDLVPCGMGLTAADFPAAVKGKFALIQRGQIPFADKVNNAIAAGAVGAILYNNAAGLVQGTVAQDGKTVEIPVAMIEQTVGESLVADYSQGGHPALTMQTISTDYASFDGTSMATPHVAGVVALVKAASSSLTPAQVKDVLQQTASPAGCNATECGSGIVNAEAAVTKALSASSM